VRDRLRAPLAAAAAFLIAGDLAVYGPAALLDLWRFLFPFLWLFLALEALRRRFRIFDEEAFLLGAAAGLLHDGALTKVLQDGVFFLGVNWLSAAAACFDWGMLTVVALHVADALVPRPADDGAAAPSLPTAELVALVFLPAGALLLYLFDLLVGRARFERMLGPTWLLADALFLGAAALLTRRALRRAEDAEPGERGLGVWILCVFCAWLSGAQLASRAGGEWPALLSVILVAAWTGGVGYWTYRAWSARGRLAAEPRRACLPILILAAWRFAGAALIGLVIGPLDADGRGAAAFAFFVDLPTRLLFLAAFFSTRLAV
jgi:hypothetical protein